MAQISILLADDHNVVRDGLRALLHSQDDLIVIGEASTGRQAVGVVKELRPTIVVMDIGMPLLNGLEATRQILSVAPATRVLILSAYNDDEYVEQALQSGAAGYLLKQSCTAMLTKAIRELVKGLPFLDPTLPRRLRSITRGPNGVTNSQAERRLTSREEEVLQMIAEGAANKQIAAELGVSIKTIEKHRQHVMDKLNIHNTAGLTRYAIAAGIIEGKTQPPGIGAG